MSSPTTITQNEAEIRQLITDQQQAICTKNIDQIMAYYASEVTIFDVKPPFQTQGKQAYRQTWEECMPYFPDSFEIETRDLKIIVNENLAVAHWLFHFTGTEPDHPAMQTWMRITTVCQKLEDKWQILHEHCSVPFDPETSQAAFSLDP